MKSKGCWSTFLLLFGFVFLAIGCVFMYFAAQATLQVLDTYSWHRVPATIQNIDISYPEMAPDGRDENVFELVTEYEYTLDAVMRNSTVFHRHPYTADSYESLADRKWQIVRSEQDFAFVNPDDLDESILERQSLWIGLFILAPIPFVIIGLVSLVVALGFFPTRELKSWKSPQQPGKVGHVLFGLAFLVGGSLLALGMGIRPCMKSIAAGGWEEVPCRVMWSRVKVHIDDENDGDTYSPDIFYEYEYEGQTHRSNRYSFAGWSSSGRKGKQRIVAAYPSGAEKTCFVDPDTPWHAVLNRKTPWMAYFFLPLGVLLGGIGAAVLGTTWRRKRLLESAWVK